MKMLVLPARYTPDSIALYGAAVEAGWEVERLLSWRPPAHLRTRDVAIYGESLFGAIVARELSRVLLEPPFGWLAELPRKFVSRDVFFTTLDDAKKWPGRAFIKPADDKCFPASVYQNGSAIPVSDAVPGQTPVLVSEPVVWRIEFRFFIFNRSVATFSAYSRNGALIQPDVGVLDASSSESEEAFHWCSEMIADASVQIPPSVALDIGRMENRGWAVVEANAAWASGIYRCDPARVLPVVARACLKSGDVADEEKRWVVDRVSPTVRIR
jgi:hypothetical protein